MTIKHAYACFVFFADEKDFVFLIYRQFYCKTK